MTPSRKRFRMEINMKNKEWASAAEKVIVRIFLVLAAVVFTAIFCYSMMETWENGWDLGDDTLYLKRDSLTGNIFWMAVSLTVMWIVHKMYDKISHKPDMRAVLGVFCLLAGIFSIYWVGASNTEPQADQWRLCDLAVAFDHGDCSGLAKGEYAGRNPHQLGLITIIRCLFRIFGENNYRAFQYFSALLVPVILFSGFQVIKRITKDDKRAEFYYLILMLLCVPMYGYVPFVYGEICSTAFTMLTAWMVLDSLDKFSWIKTVALGITMGTAVLMRENTLIFLIAFLIVTAVKLLDNCSWKTAAIGISMILGVVAGKAAVHSIYAPVTPEDSKAIPSVLYVVMGTNDERSGWYNMYHREVFEACDFDPELAARQGRADLALFLEKCRKNPGYAADFYYRKMNTQWNEPMYQCLGMNNGIAGSQSPLAEKVYFGELRYGVLDFMNIYQLLVYGGVVCLLAVNGKRWVRIENYILLIGVFGGFLFSLMWEAKTRYVFPYFMMMIPYAAMGISEITGRVERNIRRNGKERSNRFIRKK